MSLVLETESLLTPKRLRSLGATQAKDDKPIELEPTGVSAASSLPQGLLPGASSLLAALRALLGSSEESGFLRVGLAPAVYHGGALASQRGKQGSQWDHSFLALG